MNPLPRSNARASTLTFTWVAQAVCISLVIPAEGRAQCTGQWLTSEPFPGTNDSIEAATVWDPDGSLGPAPEQLVIAGEFTIAGEARARGVAAWDGQRWSQLGSGLVVPDSTFGTITTVGLFALTTFNGELIAGGRLQDARFNSRDVTVYHYSNGEWQPLGDLSALVPQRTAYALAVHNGQLFAAGGQGSPNQVGGQRPFVARWDGARWELIGSNATGMVSALSSNGTELVVAGAFSAFGGISASNIARWDGGGWLPMASGLPRQSWRLAVHAGRIHAGTFGSQSSADSNIFVWNGTDWQALGAVSSTVSALGTHEGSLYAASAFPVGSGSEYRIARWDGTTWQPLPPNDPATSYGVHSLTSYQGFLIAAGTMRGTGNNIARWDGATWRTLAGTTTPATIPSSLSIYGGNLIATGGFVGGVCERGTEWRILGEGLSDNSIYPPGVMSSTSYRGDLVVTGSFSRSGTVPVSTIATWNGRSWSQLGSYSGGAYACMVANDRLYVGAVREANDPLWVGVAQWDGVHWSRVGERILGTPRSLAWYNGELFAAISDIDFHYITRWNGTRWAALNSAFAWPTCLAVFRDKLVVGGSSIIIPGGGSPSCLMTWDGSRWDSLGDGISASNGQIVQAITIYRDTLVAAGRFTAAGNVGASNIARWDGVRWKPLGAGVEGSVYCLLADGDTLYVGGMMTGAGGHSTSFVAAWRDCIADLDDGMGAGVCDGGVGIEDLLFFLDRFTIGDLRVDLDDGSGMGRPDGGVTLADLLYFLDRFEQGC